MVDNITTLSLFGGNRFTGLHCYSMSISGMPINLPRMMRCLDLSEYSQDLPMILGHLSQCSDLEKCKLMTNGSGSVTDIGPITFAMP